MKKKMAATICLIVGILLICVSVIGAVADTNRKNIIGGADLPTYFFGFFRQHSGI